MLLCASLLPAGRIVVVSGETQQQHQQLDQPRKEEGFVVKPRPQKRRRAQWSTGTAPGEYGGPPLDFKPTKMWGGNKADPLQSTDDYIWKKDWQPHVRLQDEPVEAAQDEGDSGFLSLNRALALDSMDVDLSQELMKPSRATLERQVQAARETAALAERRASKPKPAWNFAPTRREEERWARARKQGVSGSETLIREAEMEQVDPVLVRERERKEYLELKRDLQTLTVGIGGLCTGFVVLYYSPEVAASYGIGLLGSLAYIRMLGDSVDSFGRSSLESAVKGVAGQPRLLVPVALVMLYNRWNELLVPQYDVVHLELIPMLIGFFTYKAATLVQTFKELLPVAESNLEKPSS